MAKSRDSYIIAGKTVEELSRNLTFLLQRFADRMDKIEGIRGTASIESDLEMNENRVTEVADASADSDALNKSQADLTGSNPTFNSIMTTTSLTVGTDATVRGNAYVYDATGNLIHSLE